MVRLASIKYNGKPTLVAEVDGGFCDLSLIASNARDFFMTAGGVDKANQLIKDINEESPNFISSEQRRLAPIGGSLVGKFLCIGMNYKVCGFC